MDLEFNKIESKSQSTGSSLENFIIDHNEDNHTLIITFDHICGFCAEKVEFKLTFQEKK